MVRDNYRLRITRLAARQINYKWLIFHFLFIIYNSVCFSQNADTMRVVLDSLQPINLSYLDVIPKEDHVLISWATKTENNNAYFTIEKSKNGKNYNKVIDVPGSGNSKTFKEYAETDYQPYNGASYYRIKQTDNNGKYSYFPTEGIVYKGKKETKPYPSQAEITMIETAELKGIKNEPALVLLQDAEGRDYTTKVIITKENEQLFGEDILKEIPPGTYTILSSSDSSIYSHNIIVK
ncbi:MAG: hypothetical protein ACYDCN_09575 [Bacteroidia bacterium]